MSFSLWSLAIESPVVQSLVIVTGGVAILVLAALFARRWIIRPHSQRMLWRATFIAAGARILAEAIGGNVMIARWMDAAPQKAVSARRDIPRPVGNYPTQATSAPEPDPHDLMSPDDDSWNGILPSRSDEPIEMAVDLATEVAYDDAPPRGRESFSPLGLSATNTLSAKKTPDPVHFGPLLVIATLVGSLVLACCFVGQRIVILWFTWRHTMAAPSAIVEIVREVARRIGGDQRLKRLSVVETPRLAAPVVYGALRPTLAVPVGFAESLPPDQLQAVLAHELVHVTGRDPLWQVACDGLAALAWWHPLVWLARAQHRAACEAAADEGASATDGGPRALAAALVRLARGVSNGPRLGWAALDARGNRRSRLGRRVLRLLREDATHAQIVSRRRGMLLTSVGACVLITSLLLGAAIARRHVSDPFYNQGEIPMTSWQTSWRSSLAAAAMAAMLGTGSADVADAADNEPQGEIAVELDLVLDDAAEVAEGALDLVLELEPQIELFFTDEEEDEAAEQEEEEEEEEEEDDDADDDDESDEDEADDEDDEEESSEEEESENAGILSRLAQAKAAAQAEMAQKQALIAREMAVAQRELAKAKGQLAGERDQMAKELQQLVAQAKAEAAAGNNDAVQKIMEQAQQLAQMQGAPRGAMIRFTNDAERRRHHLLQAAENLRAVGKNDLAEQLTQEASAIAPDGYTVKSDTPGGARTRISRRLLGDKGDEQRVELELRRRAEDDDARARNQGRVFQEIELARRGSDEVLREEMNDLRNQVNDMRAMLEKVVSRLENEESAERR